MERNGRLRRPTFKQVVLVSRSTKASAASLRWSATGAFGARPRKRGARGRGCAARGAFGPRLSNKSSSSPDPRGRAQRAGEGAQGAPWAPDFKKSRARPPTHEGERSEPERGGETSLELAT